MIRIDVCIATYRRPDMLDRLLSSLAKQDTAATFSIVVNVADNDAAGSALSVIDKHRSHLDLNYVVQPKKNISLMRNVTFAMARGEFIAIIDDDEWAAPDWLQQMLTCAQRFNADAVLAETRNIIPPDTSKAILRSGMLNVPLLVTGSTSGFFKATGNCLIRRSAIEGLGMPFDPELGISGGEDNDFFTRLEKLGRKLVWCREARVFTELHSGRNTLRYLIKRKFFRGELNAKVMIRHHPRRMLTQLPLFHAKVFAGIVVLTALGPIFWLVRAVFYKYLAKVAYHLGYLKYFYWRSTHHEYS